MHARNTLLVFFLSVCTAGAEPSLVGHWLMRSPQLVVEADFRADGTYARHLRGGGAEENIRGTYERRAETVVFHPEGGNEPVIVRARFPDENTVELTDAGGSGLRLVRQAPAPGAGRSAAAAPAADFPSGHAGGRAQERAAAPASGCRLSFFVDPVQAAFFMLVPTGWKTEGGMCGSGVPDNKVDWLDGNIKFRVTSPDGRSFFGWYPRFFFCDPRVYTASSGGLLNVPVGASMDGTWMYPYLTIPDYVRTIVFGRFAANEFVAPRLVGAFVPIPDLLKLAPQAGASAQAGCVNFACGIRGVASRGRIYTVLDQLGAGMWAPAFTVGLVAPEARWMEDQRTMEYCIRTFRLNPEYVRVATAGAAARAQAHASLVRQLNAQQMQDESRRLLHSNDSQEEFYKVLTGQIEARDPETGKETWLPKYDRAFTDGRGNYYLTDEPGNLPIENNTEWRPLQIINRNAQ